MGYLVDILTPLLYEGFFSIYEKAKSLENTYVQASKIDPNVKNPGVLILFQHFLVGVDKLSDNMIDEETNRIRDNSKCADIFDQLIKAVLKSHIIVLTYTASGQKCKLISEKLHEKIEPKYFIHKCYVECARLFYDHPTLFWHEFPNSELRDNQRIIYQLTKIGIKNAIKRCLPMKEVLETYLNNDYIEEESVNSENEYVKIKDLLKKDNMRDDGGIMKIINSSESATSEDITKLETNIQDLSSLIFNRNIYDTLDGKSLSSDVKKSEQHIAPIVADELVEEKQLIVCVSENNEIIEDKQDEIKIQKSEIKHSDAKENKEDAQKYLEEKKAEDVRRLEEQFLANVKSKNVKANILFDAVQAITKDIEPKKEPRKKNDDKISIVRKSHSHSIDDNDNFFEEII